MLCAISGEAPEEPVVSKKTGTVYEKRLIEKYIEQNGKEPGTDEELDVQDLLPLQSSRVVRPRPPTLTSIPALLSTFQNEWDSLALETYNLQEQLTQTRMELATALYQHDAAIRVIARLTKERDEARSSLAQITVVSGGGAADDSMAVDNEELPEDLSSVVDATLTKLSKSRKRRPVPAGWATADEISSFSPLASDDLPVKKATSMALGGEGKYAAVAGLDGSVAIYSVEAQKLERSLAVGEPVTAALWIDSKIVLGTAKGTVKIIDGGKEVASLREHAGAVTGLAMHPSGRILVSVGPDKTLAFYDLDSLSRVSRSHSHASFTSVAFHPDGHLVGAGNAAGDIQVFMTKTGAEAATFSLGAPVQALAFSENGYWIAATAKGQTTVTIFDLRKEDDEAMVKMLDMGNAVSALAWDYSGQFLAAAGPSGVVVQQYVKGSKAWSQTLSSATPAVSVQWGAEAKQLLSVNENGVVSVLGAKDLRSEGALKLFASKKSMDASSPASESRDVSPEESEPLASGFLSPSRRFSAASAASVFTTSTRTSPASPTPASTRQQPYTNSSQSDSATWLQSPSFVDVATTSTTSTRTGSEAPAPLGHYSYSRAGIVTDIATFYADLAEYNGDASQAAHSLSHTLSRPSLNRRGLPEDDNNDNNDDTDDDIDSSSSSSSPSSFSSFSPLTSLHDWQDSDRIDDIAEIDFYRYMSETQSPSHLSTEDGEDFDITSNDDLSEPQDLYDEDDLLDDIDFDDVLGHALNPEDETEDEDYEDNVDNEDSEENEQAGEDGDDEDDEDVSAGAGEDGGQVGREPGLVGADAVEAVEIDEEGRDEGPAVASNIAPSSPLAFGQSPPPEVDAAIRRAIEGTLDIHELDALTWHSRHPRQPTERRSQRQLPQLYQRLPPLQLGTDMDQQQQQNNQNSQSGPTEPMVIDLTAEPDSPVLQQRTAWRWMGPPPDRRFPREAGGNGRSQPTVIDLTDLNDDSPDPQAWAPRPGLGGHPDIGNWRDRRESRRIRDRPPGRLAGLFQNANGGAPRFGLGQFSRNRMPPLPVPPMGNMPPASRYRHFLMHRPHGNMRQVHRINHENGQLYIDAVGQILNPAQMRDIDNDPQAEIIDVPMNPLLNNLPELNYEVNGVVDMAMMGDRGVNNKPPHVPPPAPREGFTRDTGDDIVMVCASCDEELIYDPEEATTTPARKARSRKEREEHHFWAVTSCGHVYCRNCFEHRRGKDACVGFVQNGKATLCAVEGCKSDVTLKKAWVGLFV